MILLLSQFSHFSTPITSEYRWKYHFVGSFRFQPNQSASKETCHKTFTPKTSRTVSRYQKANFACGNKKWKDTVSRCMLLLGRKEDGKISAESSRTGYKNAPHIFDGSSHYLISLAFDDSWGGFIEGNMSSWFDVMHSRFDGMRKNLLSRMTRDINLWLSI